MIEMIVKYYKDGAWGYIDNVRQVGSRDIDCSEYIGRYDLEVENGTREDIANFVDFYHGAEGPTIDESFQDAIVYKKLPDGIAFSNKVFLIATENLPLEIKEEGYHSENLLDDGLIINNVPASIIILYLNDHKEHDTIVLVTNQKVFLMNDKGQTIERLV